jgi:DNA-binding SARP family transcriptional activator
VTLPLRVALHGAAVLLLESGGFVSAAAPEPRRSGAQQLQIPDAIGRGRGYNSQMPDFRLLGPLEVLSGGGDPLPLGGQKQRSVLAVLLLRAGEVVSTEFLIDALWGEQPPRAATTSLHNCILALRKLLGAELIVTKAPGYILRVEREAIDLARFERLMAKARTLEGEERAALLRQALDLWRGPPLEDLAFEPFASAEVRRLEELRLNALEEWLDAELSAGRYAERVPELESLVAQHPLRERLWGQLMLALYHSGRQAEALRAYNDARRTFADELGLDPSPELRDLQARILRQEVPRPRAAAASEADHFGEVARALLAGQLVPVLGSDVGELAAQLVQRFGCPPDEGPELTRVAQYVALTRGSGPLHDELHAMLQARAAPNAIHRLLAALPPVLRERGVPHQLLVTTSYDLALEQAFLEAGEEFDVVSYIAVGRQRGRFCHVRPDGEVGVVDLPNTYATELSLDRRTVILKLHGGVEGDTAREFESFVVTEDDYIDYLAQADAGAALPVALAAKLRRSHLLFLGYGMRDWNLRLVIGRIWGGESPSYRSWAVVPVAKPLEREFWRSRDIELLESPLEEYVEALARYAGVGAALETRQ